MKKKFITNLLVTALTATTILSISPLKAEAAWLNYYGRWAYDNGGYLATGWKQVGEIWYYFDSNGMMQTGWINDGGYYYYLDQSGMMQTGVIQVNGKIYILAPSGQMQTGSVVIGAKMYYFGPDGSCVGTEVPTPLKAYDYYGNPVQPYVPSQIATPGIEMNTEIPLDVGERARKEFRVYYKDDDGDAIITKKVECDISKSSADIVLYEPEKNGYEFIEWNTKKNGNGTSYDAGDKIQLKGDLTLYAQWSEIEEKEEEEENIKVTGITIKYVVDKNSSNNDDGTGTPTVSVGDTLQFTRKISPSNATNTKVTWSVKNGVNGTNGKAEISSNGILTGVQAGTVIVKATANDGSRVYKEMKVIIE